MQVWLNYPQSSAAIAYDSHLSQAQLQVHMAQPSWRAAASAYGSPPSSLSRPLQGSGRRGQAGTLAEFGTPVAGAHVPGGSVRARSCDRPAQMITGCFSAAMRPAKPFPIGGMRIP